MLLKNRQVVDSQVALGKMLNTSLPIKQAYCLNKTIEAVKNQLLFIEEQRIDLIKKYGVEKEEGNFEIPIEAEGVRSLFFRDYDQLLDLEEEIDVRKLTLDDLTPVELTPNELDTIDFIIKADE